MPKGSVGKNCASLHFTSLHKIVAGAFGAQSRKEARVLATRPLSRVMGLPGIHGPVIGTVRMVLVSHWDRR